MRSDGKCYGVIDINYYSVMGFSIYEQGKGSGSLTPPPPPHSANSARFSRTEKVLMKNKNTIKKFLYEIYCFTINGKCMYGAQDLTRSWTSLTALFEVNFR